MTNTARALSAVIEQHTAVDLSEEAAQDIIADLTARGYAIVPIEPTPGKLMSMAIRYDHGLGVPGYYDQLMFSKSGVSHERRLESTLGTMKQLHEEVVGTGFYREEKEGEYLAWSKGNPPGT